MEQALDNQEKITDQTVTQQQDTTTNNEVKNASVAATIDSTVVQKAQQEKKSFWFSWYSVVMFFILGFFVYYFSRLIGFPSEFNQAMEYITLIIQSIGMVIAIMLLLTEYSYIIYNPYVMSIFIFVAPMPMIYVLRQVQEQANVAEQPTDLLFLFQICDLIAGMLLIILIFHYIFQRKPNIASIRAALQRITAKWVFTFLLAMLGAITVIVPFMQFLISMIVGKP